MATVACPGCGLPRVESELGTKPCPVCDAAPVAAAPRAKAKPDTPDPTAGMPADVSELNAPGAPAATRAPLARPWLTYCAVAFLFGVICGVGGVLGIQALDRPEPKADEPEVAAKPSEELSFIVQPTPAAKPQPPEVAPMPHEPVAQVAVAEPPPEPEPEANVKQIKAPLPGHVETHEFNEPRETYSVPPLKKGEHVILKSKEKVKALRIHSLDGGAVLDASGLEAEVITISGKIDSGSILKLRTAPKGTVHISSKVDGKANVEIVAPDGEVKFLYTTTPAKEGSKIDNGSKVAITARVVEFKGDIGGADTKVFITLCRNAWLKVASVSGSATVEYKSQMPGWSPPDVIVGPVAPGATFRRAE